MFRSRRLPFVRVGLPRRVLAPGGLRGPGPAPAVRGRRGPGRTPAAGTGGGPARRRPGRGAAPSLAAAPAPAPLLPGQVRPGELPTSRPAGGRPAAGGPGAGGRSAPAPAPALPPPAACRSASSDASAAATRSARVNGSPGSSSPRFPSPNRASSAASAAACLAASSAASFRSPSSVRFASFDAFAPTLVPSSATDPDLPHAQPRAQQQHLREQGRGRLGELLPEPGDRHVVGHVPGADHPERHVLLAQPLDPPRGRHPVRVRPDQQRQHHVRVIARRPRPARPAPRVERRGIQPPHRLDHQPHRVPRRQPLPHVRREQERLITVNRAVPLRHTPFYRTRCRQTREHVTPGQPILQQPPSRQQPFPTPQPFRKTVPPGEFVEYQAPRRSRWPCVTLPKCLAEAEVELRRQPRRHGLCGACYSHRKALTPATVWGGRGSCGARPQQPQGPDLSHRVGRPRVIGARPQQPQGPDLSHRVGRPRVMRRPPTATTRP